MAERKWEEARDLILSQIKDCPWPMARLNLLRAAREFYTETMAWSTWTDDLFTIAGLDEYTPYAGRGIEVIRVLHASVGGKAYAGANEADFGIAVMNNTSQSLASWFDDAVHIYPTPVADEIPMKAYIAVRPSYASTGLPPDQWKFIDYIIEGALEKLMLTPSKPYTDLKLAAVHMTNFKKFKGAARSVTAAGGFAKQRVAGHYF